MASGRLVYIRTGTTTRRRVRLLIIMWASWRYFQRKYDSEKERNFFLMCMNKCLHFIRL